MKTLEQLNELSDYERNCAVAEKLGYVVLKRGMGDDVLIKTMKLARPVNYCSNPNDIMPILFANHISLHPNGWYQGPEIDGPMTFSGWWNANHEPSRTDVNNERPLVAGVICFLLMELDK